MIKPAKPTLYLAELETDNFSFRAFAQTEAGARDMMIRVLVAHGKQHGLTLDWGCAWEDAINIIPAQAGTGFRDHQRIIP